MHNSLRAVAGEHASHRVAVAQFELAKSESRLNLELRQAGLFQPHVVVRIEIVEADDLAAARQQSATDVKPDEAGGAGDESFSHAEMRPEKCDQEEAPL